MVGTEEQKTHVDEWAKQLAKREAQIARNQAFPRRLFVDRQGYVRDGWITAGFVAVSVAIVLFVVGGTVAIALRVDEAGCHSRWRAAGIESSWEPLQGCVIKTDHGWLPEKAFRDVRVH